GGEAAVAQRLHETGDVLALGQASQSDQTGVAHRDHDAGIVRQETEMIEAARGHRFGVEPLADLFDHGHPMVRIDDLLSHLESHSDLLKECQSPTAESFSKEPLPGAANYREKCRKRQTRTGFGQAGSYAIAATYGKAVRAVTNRRRSG